MIYGPNYDPSFVRRPGWVTVDCHVHTQYSGDAITTLDELAERVVDVGLDVVCITDHNTIRGAVRAAAEPAFPARVVVGEEVRTYAGEIIGLFLNQHIPAQYRPRALCELIHGQGGITYLPHPTDMFANALSEVEREAAAPWLDAIEVWNAKVMGESVNFAAADLAQALGRPGGAGSDAHYPEFVGQAFLHMPDFDGPPAFLAALPEAEVYGRLYRQGDRDWDNKVRPSIEPL